MDNWVLKGAQNLVNENSGAATNITSPTQLKVKVTHFMFTDYDALLYNGTIKAAYPKTIGRAAVGIVTETGKDCYGLERNMRVYLNPSRPCGKCLACKSGKPRDCTSVLSAGKDFDGFLRDFVVADYSDVAPLPDFVDEFSALCIEAVGVAENIYDKLNLPAGSRVAVIGGDYTGNIIAQVLQYHKLVPIVIDNSQSNIKTVKQCGVYFTFAADEELDNNISNATSGDMCDAAVYCAESRLPLSLATRIVADGKQVILSGFTAINSTISGRDILEKNLTVLGVSDAYDYTDTVINMLLHGAVNLNVFKKEILSEYNPAELIKEQCENFTSAKKGKMKVLKMIF